MKFEEAMKIINKKESEGFMVSFEHKDGIILRSDHFPDKHAGEKLIETETEAWILANKFAEATKGKCINIYVVDSNFLPVKEYKLKEIVNRD